MINSMKCRSASLSDDQIRALRSDPIRYDTLLEQYRDGMRRYIEEGIRPGGALMAALENNLVEAVIRFDHIPNLHSIVSWLWNDCPAVAWGNHETVKRWLSVRNEAVA